MSSSSSTTSSTTAGTTPTSSNSIYLNDKILHHEHTRLLLQQQHQAILTTYDDWRIILTNDIAQEVLMGYHDHFLQSDNHELVGKSVINDLIDPNYQTRLKEIVEERRMELINHQDEFDHVGGMVLVCGNVIPIVKLNGTKSSASLWLKEKKNEAGSSVFIWIFEEVFESQSSITIDHNGIISNVDKGVQTLFDYEPNNLIGQQLCKLMPGITSHDDIHRFRFFGSQTSKGANFPIIVKNESGNIQITSMPVIAGLVTVKKDMIIAGCNDVFVKYLFGFSQQELAGKNISLLLPQFNTLIENLQHIEDGLILNNIICRKLIKSNKKRYSLLEDYKNRMVSTKQLTYSQQDDKEPLPFLFAVHRDGTPFEIQLQMKIIEDEYALWISFDRDIACKRFGHSSSEQAEKKAILKPGQVIREQRSPAVISASNDELNLSNHKQEEQNIPSPSLPPPQVIEYSAQTRKTNIDDYIILDSLGQGAYGLVKLAIKRDDPEQKRVVIKYVIKSRILVDCWTRDRKLGTVPVEIHILHTLRKTPHKNLGDMLDYFEDNDYYYIVMELHGAGMDLFDYIEYKEQIEEGEIRTMFRQVAEGVCHLHDNKIVHRDIKDENVVLDDIGGLRLIDFGSAAYLKTGRKYETFVGTLDYAAPEVLKGQTYSGKPQDVWALGILLFTLVYRENPFYDIDEIMSRELRVPFVLSEGSVDLINKMLERDIDKRLDIHQVLAHPWLTCV
ncbi:Pkinase-domain-containing protein [Backusella circina FSU 941]|nr:Pkinase-domain-containing protein [Backusella circina FSU 941]